jgi:D-xylose transport system ATP-binding protein
MTAAAIDTAVPALEVVHAKKSFGSVQALADVSLTLYPGEVVALLGDNGAGKSTLIKALSGVHTLDEGTISVDGAEVTMKSPQIARRLGIETVYQDLAVFDNLDALSNLFVGRELSGPAFLGPLGFLKSGDMARRWEQYAERLRVVVRDPRQAVGLMSGGQRQAVAVARAMAFASRVVILDEPTAALGVRESGQVLELVRRLPEQGVGVILISHNMQHVAQVADRAVVLRLGRNVGEARPTPENQEYLVSLVMGAERWSDGPPGAGSRTT